MTIIGEILQALSAGIKIGFQAIFSVIPFYHELSNIRTDIIAAVLGIPSAVIVIIILLIKGIKYLYSYVQTK